MRARSALVVAFSCILCGCIAAGSENYPVLTEDEIVAIHAKNQEMSQYGNRLRRDADSIDASLDFIKDGLPIWTHDAEWIQHEKLTYLADKQRAADLASIDAKAAKEANDAASAKAAEVSEKAITGQSSLPLPAPIANQAPNEDALRAGPTPAEIKAATKAKLSGRFKSYDEVRSALSPLIKETGADSWRLLSNPMSIKRRVFSVQMSILQVIENGDFILVPPPEVGAGSFFYGIPRLRHKPTSPFVDDEHVALIGEVVGIHRYVTAFGVLKTVPEIRIYAMQGDSSY